MDKIFYYFVLAIVTTYCVCVTEVKTSKVLFIISSICWWLLFVGEIITKIV